VPILGKHQCSQFKAYKQKISAAAPLIIAHYAGPVSSLATMQKRDSCNYHISRNKTLKTDEHNNTYDDF